MDELSREDAAPSFELASRTGVHGGLDFAQWQSFKDWSVWKNPYAGELPGGVVLREDDRLFGFADHLYVPFFVDDWEGVVCNLGSICLEPALGGIEGLKFVRGYAKQAPTPMHYASHLNKQLGGIWKRMKANLGAGSEIAHQLRLSFSARVIRRLQRTPISQFTGTALGIGSLARPVALMSEGVRRIIARNYDYSIVSPETIDDCWLDDLWARAQGDANMGIRREASYLRCRYQAHPRKSSFYWLLVETRENSNAPIALVIIEKLNRTGFAGGSNSREDGASGKPGAVQFVDSIRRRGYFSSSMKILFLAMSRWTCFLTPSSARVTS